jgi:AbrB family looped-hinge helix DNA binding protein
MIRFLSDIKAWIRMVVDVSEQTRIGKRFTLVIPKTVRTRLGLKEGQRVLVRVEEGRLLVEPLPWNPYEVLQEVVGEPYAEREEAAAERWLQDHARS